MIVAGPQKAQAHPYLLIQHCYNMNNISVHDDLRFQIVG